MKDWSNRAWDAISSLLKDIEETPFVKELADGSLSEKRFCYYIAQDIIYMRNFEARLNLLLKQSESTPFVTWIRDSIDNALIIEKSLHKILKTKFNIEPSISKCNANLAYDAMLEELKQKCHVELTAASLLPCFWVYAHIGYHIFETSKIENNPYKDWIMTYNDASFQSDAEDFCAFCDALSVNVSDNMQMRMIEVFVKSTRLELEFWLDCYNNINL